MIIALIAILASLAIEQRKLAYAKAGELQGALNEVERQKTNAEEQRMQAVVGRGEAVKHQEAAERQRNLAEEQRKLAEEQRERAEQQERAYRRLLYAAHMNLAQQDWETANVGRMKELLNAHLPKPGQEDLRGFEWYYLWRLCHSDLITLRHASAVESVAFSPDGKTLATGGRSNTVKLWDVASGKELATLKGHTNHANSVAFSPDGKTLATGSDDHIVKLWDVASRQELAALKGHTSEVYSVAYSRLWLRAVGTTR
jgi:predicted NACHT family NTPase